jgi:hypothetical protein
VGERRFSARQRTFAAGKIEFGRDGVTYFLSWKEEGHKHDAQFSTFEEAKCFAESRLFSEDAPAISEFRVQHYPQYEN